MEHSEQLMQACLINFWNREAIFDCADHNPFGSIPSALGLHSTSYMVSEGVDGSETESGDGLSGAEESASEVEVSPGADGLEGDSCLTVRPKWVQEVLLRRFTSEDFRTAGTA